MFLGSGLFLGLLHFEAVLDGTDDQVGVELGEVHKLFENELERVEALLRLDTSDENAAATLAAFDRGGLDLIVDLVGHVLPRLVRVCVHDLRLLDLRCLDQALR